MLTEWRQILQGEVCVPDGKNIDIDQQQLLHSGSRQVEANKTPSVQVQYTLLMNVRITEVTVHFTCDCAF